MNWFKKLLHMDKQLKNVYFLPSTKLPVERVLKTAVEERLTDVSIVGWTQDGKLFLATSYPKRAELHWDLLVAAREVLG